MEEGPSRQEGNKNAPGWRNRCALLNAQKKRGKVGTEGGNILPASDQGKTGLRASVGNGIPSWKRKGGGGKRMGETEKNMWEAKPNAALEANQGGGVKREKIEWEVIAYGSGEQLVGEPWKSI